MAQDTMSVFYCHSFETGAHYMVQAGLKLKSSCLSLLRTGIISACNHFLNMTLFNFEILPFVFLMLNILFLPGATACTYNFSCAGGWGKMTVWASRVQDQPRQCRDTCVKISKRKDILSFINCEWELSVLWLFIMNYDNLFWPMKFKTLSTNGDLSPERRHNSSKVRSLGYCRMRTPT